MRILVNYMYDAKTNRYEVIRNNVVLADQKWAVLETEAAVNEPLIVPVDLPMPPYGPGGVEKRVVDRATWESQHKLFGLKVKDGIPNDSPEKELEETSPRDPKAVIVKWLPKNTDVSKLVLLNNSILSLKEVQETPTKDANEKEPVKKETKPAK